MAKVDYGIDAPGVVRNLALCGAALLIVRAFTATIRIGPVNIINFEWPGVALLVTAGLMVLYSKVGKMRHRDRMIRMAALKGDEKVLDVGTGRGLLLIAAAKKLSAGHAVGIDIWKASDLSENLRERTQKNLALEGVADQCELIDSPAEKMQFADSHFDVVLSNMCLHNIPKAEERREACMEIVRVLKPGGAAVISDFKNTGSYARAFKDAGLAVSKKFYLADTFFPVSIVYARKPA
ncbi:MAG: class I SAM-dependent methyltransferase [Alloacidobacterium sp.]